MLCKCGSVKAQAVFERIPNEDVAVWSAMINGHAVHGMGNEALSLSTRCKMKKELSQMTLFTPSYYWLAAIQD